MTKHERFVTALIPLLGIIVGYVIGRLVQYAGLVQP